MIDGLEGVDEAAVLGEIGKFGQLLLVDHVEAARRTDC